MNFEGHNERYTSYDFSAWNDNDSALGDDIIPDVDLSSTASLTSSVLAYRQENGRRYHAFRDGQYFMPNDDQEQQGMELMHQISQMILGGRLFRAPIGPSPQHILDIGTGTGAWPIDVADQYPAAHVIATDLSPIQPSWVPPNLEFQVDDCESSWDFNKKFDYIHMRNLAGSIADWPLLLKNCYEHLNPGGWLEVSNIEIWGWGDFPPDSASAIWQENLKYAASLIGRQLDMAPYMIDLQRQAGFVDVFDDPYMCPMSEWKENMIHFTRWFSRLIDIELEALSLRLYTQVLGWPPEQLRDLLLKVRGEIANPEHKLYTVMFRSDTKRLDTFPVPVLELRNLSPKPTIRDGAGIVDNLKDLPSYIPGDRGVVTTVTKPYELADHEQWVGAAPYFDSLVTDQDYVQPRQFWEMILNKDPDQQARWIDIIASRLSKARPDIRQSSYDIFSKITNDLGAKIEMATEAYPAKPNEAEVNHYVF